MTRRPGDESDPPGGHAAERLREFLEQRFPGGIPPEEGSEEEEEEQVEDEQTEDRESSADEQEGPEQDQDGGADGGAPPDHAEDPAEPED